MNIKGSHQTVFWEIRWPFSFQKGVLMRRESGRGWNLRIHRKRKWSFLYILLNSNKFKDIDINLFYWHQFRISHSKCNFRLAQIPYSNCVWSESLPAHTHNIHNTSVSMSTSARNRIICMFICTSTPWMSLNIYVRVISVYYVLCDVLIFCRSTRVWNFVGCTHGHTCYCNCVSA